MDEMTKSNVCRFIKLPLIERWTYGARPCDSRPVLNSGGILVNLDRVAQIKPHSDHLTFIDENSIPCSLESIQRAWEESARPISSILPEDAPLPYHPWWEGRFEPQQ